MTMSGHYVITVKAGLHLIAINIITMKLAKSKNIPQILFEKDMPQLSIQSKVVPHFDAAFFGTMFLAATILTFIFWFVLDQMFGENFMDG